MKKLLLIAFVLFAAVACAPKEGEPKAKHVFVIAFDGWGSYSMESVDMPNTRALMAEGCYTLQKRTVLPSDSAPNWASMFAGAPNEFHGWSNNGSGPDVKPIYLNENGSFPTIFSLIREQMPEAETACVYEWGGIKPLIDHKSINFCVKEKPENIAPVSTEYIKSKKPDFMVIIYDDSIFIITSDHGGINTSHGGRSLMEMDTPFIIAGKNIKQGGEFSEAMMQYDTAATIAEAFGLQTPQIWRGQSMSQVFE